MQSDRRFARARTAFEQVQPVAGPAAGKDGSQPVMPLSARGRSALIRASGLARSPWRKAAAGEQRPERGAKSPRADAARSRFCTGTVTGLARCGRGTPHFSSVESSADIPLLLCVARLPLAPAEGGRPMPAARAKAVMIKPQEAAQGGQGARWQAMKEQ